MSPPADFWDRVAREVAKLMVYQAKDASAKVPSEGFRAQPAWPQNGAVAAGISQTKWVHPSAGNI